MPEGLKIQVGADVQQANKALGSLGGNIEILEKQFARLQKIASMPGLTFRQQERLNGLLLSTQRELNQYKRGLDAVNPALTKFASTSSAATQSTINLGRVIQDAPFGFLGIANNLNPLLESFQRLKTSTGSTGGALKALGQSLTGAGGIGLALSVVSSLLIVFGDRLFSSTAGINLTEVATNKFKTALKELGDQINDIKGRLDFSAEVQKLQFVLSKGVGVDANVFGFKLDAGNAQKLITEIDKRIDVLGTSVLKFTPKLNEFNEAVANIPLKFLTKGQALLKLYGDINKIPEDALGKLGSAERSFITKFQEASKELVSLEKSKSEAVKAIKISGLKGEQAVEDERLRLLKEQQEEAKRNNEKAKADYARYVSEVISEAKRLSDAFKNVIDLKLESNFFDTQKETFKKSLKFLTDFKSRKFSIIIDPELELNKDQLKIQSDLIEKALREGINITDIGFKTPVDVELLPTILDKEDYRSRFKKQLDELHEKINLKVPVTIDLSVPQAGIQAAMAKAAAALAALRKPAEDAAKAVNAAIASIATEGLSTIGEAIGLALTGGDVGSAFKAFAASLGEAIESLGKQLIGIGTAALLANEALKTLFTGPQGAILAIGAGVALVAAGAALKNALSGGIKGFAKGGLVSGPQLALIGEGSGTSRSNPEVVAPLDQLRSMLSDLGGGGTQRVLITGRLRGNDMLLQNARTSRSQRRTTGR